ncbi:MAG: hypothetical protein AB7F43_00680 [Bacteriovoracia bacterium]
MLLRKHYNKTSLFILGLAVAACWMSTVTNPFYYDDVHCITKNPAIRSLTNIPKFFYDSTASSILLSNQTFRPLGYVGFTFSWLLGDGASWPFHLYKIIFLFFGIFGVFLVWGKLFERLGIDHAKQLALIGSLFLAIHPALSHSMNYIIATTSLQAAVFYIWGIIFYLRFREARKTYWLVLSLFSFAAAVLSKEEAITFPIMILLLDFVLKQKRSLSINGLFFILAIILVCWFYFVFGKQQRLTDLHITRYEYLLTQLRGYLFYQRVFLLPYGLNADHVQFGFSRSMVDLQVIWALIANACIIGFSFFYRKRFPEIFLGVFWFYIAILPASSIFPLSEPVNEHRMILSYFGFIGAITGGIYRFSRFIFCPKTRASILGFIGIVVFICFIFESQYRNYVWANPGRMWEDVVEKNSTSGRAYNFLGLYALSKRNLEKAEIYFSRCERLWPAWPYCKINFAIAKKLQNKPELAVKKIKQALAIQPDISFAHFYLGLIYEEDMHNTDLAIESYKKADLYSSNKYLEAKKQLAAIYLRLGKKAEYLEYKKQIEHLN